jgi:hypothetical protein
MFDAVLFLVSVLNPVACVSIVDDVTQVSFVSVPADLLWRSDATGRVFAQALAVVRVLVKEPPQE